MQNKIETRCHSHLASTGSISPLASDEDIAGMARGDLGHLFLMFGGTSSCWTNDSSLSGKILTNKNLIYLYLNFLVICKSLTVLCLIYSCSVQNVGLMESN